MITKFHAIQSLVPGAQVSVAVGNGEVTWIDPPVAPVTEDQISQELQRLQQISDENQYRQRRALEYPSIGDQLDALYHAGVFPPYMAAKIQAVKAKYPPPQQQDE